MNMANALRDLHRYAEALEYYEKAEALLPSSADVHWNKSLCLLSMGNFEQGWEEYEWRRTLPDLYDSSRQFGAPLWLGEESLSGKTILLHAEQGLGDSIQFCRYAACVGDMGAKVILEVQQPLINVLAGLEGVEHLVPRGSDIACDFHAPLLSIPFALRNKLDTVPAKIPYLRADPELIEQWREVTAAKPGPRVGLVWSGNVAFRNNRRRSISLQTMLAALPAEAHYWSLQKDVSDEDEALIRRSGNMQRFGLTDFAHTAAQIMLMDVVISVDTSIAHLAAALGKPTWVLLSFKSDWRWMSDRSDSPWYPNVTLFRQDPLGDWNPVLDRVGRSILDLISPGVSAVD
jgi:hypothetical protein